MYIFLFVFEKVKILMNLKRTVSFFLTAAK